MLLRRFIYLTVAILGIAAIWFEMAATRAPKQAAIPAFGNVPDFKLTERSGKTVTLADMRGKIWVASFFYASCPGQCPVMNGRLSALQADALKNEGVYFVSITTQPETDTPAVLKEYADRFHASDRWLFLTGDKEQIFKLSNQGFLLTAADQTDPSAGAEPVIHSTKLVLVDRSGKIRGYYDAMDEDEVKALSADIKKLMRE
ncbi:MAG TPA: SCO family protein [Chthoniobacteraceae bacterium]|nr:SCO family protein [Chthoniobacteraceae bacterium]